jgi:hypothetical protein
MTERLRKLADNLSAFTNLSKEESSNIEEMASPVSVSDDLLGALRALWKAEDALRIVDGKYHYATKGTLGGTGHPVKDKKARKAIEGTYKFVKKLQQELSDVTKGVGLLSNNKKNVDAEIAAMFGEDINDREDEVVSESAEEMVKINKGREIADSAAKALMKKLDRIPGLDTKDFLKADGWGNAGFTIERDGERHPVSLVVEYRQVGRYAGKYVVSFEVQTPITRKKGWDSEDWFREYVDDATEKVHMAVKGSRYHADRWSKFYIDNVPEEKVQGIVDTIVKVFPVRLSSSLKEDVDGVSQDSVREMGIHDQAVKRANEIEDTMDKIDAMMALKKSYNVAKKLPNIREISKRTKGVKEDLDELMWGGYTDSILDYLDAADSRIGDFTIVQAAISRKSTGKKK